MKLGMRSMLLRERLICLDVYYRVMTLWPRIVGLKHIYEIVAWRQGTKTLKAC